MATKTKTFGQRSVDLRKSTPVARRQLWRPRGDADRRQLIGAEGMAAELDRRINRGRLTTTARRIRNS